jgi:uncharacterized protein (TIGR00251 family)
MTIEIHSLDDGAAFKIRAQAGARADQLRGEQDGVLKVAVAQAPEKGKANKAIIEFLAKTLGLRRSNLEIISGHTSSQKQVLVRGLSASELAERLDRVINAS